MSTTASLIIRKKMNDTLCRIVIQIIHNRQNSSMSTGVFVDPESWDAAKSRIKSSCKLYDNITQVNSILADRIKSTLDKILELEKKGTLQSMSLRSLMNYLNPRRSGITVIEALDERRSMLIEQKSVGLSNICLNAANMLRNTFNDHLTFAELTTRKLDEIRLLYNAKNSTTNGNGLKTYLAQIRKAYKSVLGENKITENKEFEDYHLKTKKPVKRSMAIPYIQRIINLNCIPNTYKYHCRNILIFMYLQGGINMIDLLLLKPDNVNNGRLVYVRRKTKKLYDQPLANRSLDIINEYLKDKTSNDYIFPILNNKITEEPELTEHYYRRYQYVNTIIKEIGKEIQAPIKLTSYVTRHSWASHARDAKVSFFAIQGGLGHESSRTTEKYLNEIDKGISDEAFSTVEKNLG